MDSSRRTNDGGGLEVESSTAGATGAGDHGKGWWHGPLPALPDKWSIADEDVISIDAGEPNGLDTWEW